MKNNNRNSYFEVMRLLAMFFIVFEHCLIATSGGLAPLSREDNIVWLLNAFTICAVNLFFLLTGYFAKSEAINYIKLIKLWLKTVFYSILIYLIAVVLGADDFGVKILLSYMTPVFSKKYWFMQTYIVLSFLAPFVVRVLEHTSKKEFRLLIAVLLVFFSIHQTFIPVEVTLDRMQGQGIIWAVVMLIIGYYIRVYGKDDILRINKWLYFIAYFVMAVGIFITNYLIVKYDIAQGMASRGNFYAYNSFSVFLEGLCLFIFFVKISEKQWNSKVVNYMSMSALSVYLISSHPELLYPLWSEIFHFDIIKMGIVKYVAFGVAGTVIIMICCISIDKCIEAIANKITKGRLS